MRRAGDRTGSISARGSAGWRSATRRRGAPSAAASSSPEMQHVHRISNRREIAAVARKQWPALRAASSRAIGRALTSSAFAVAKRAGPKIPSASAAEAASLHAQWPRAGVAASARLHERASHLVGNRGVARHARRPVLGVGRRGRRARRAAMKRRGRISSYRRRR